ncbi:MAG: DASS family sodium-coupled anion symporter [Alphaproteobacteria bacterium]|nr:DASS family sodium-coupled anion symporter [Alphaproteobacteria bacterium]MBQ3944102.1 DASS family sodium-coupled anion symporter [Alphaproteobacteria bacterium]
MLGLTINKEIKIFRLVAIVVIATLAWMFLKPVAGLSDKALHMIIIFVATMTGVMLEVCSTVAFLLMSMLIANLTGTIEVKEGFCGFSNIVPWLLFLVLSLATAITKTSLGMRLAYIFMKFFGKGINGLSYSIILTELFVAPVLPSNTARAASIGYPLVTSLSKYISANVKNVTEKSIGSYLSVLYSSSNAVCSSLFLTAMISNAIIVEVMRENNIHMTWLTWTKFAIVPGIIILAVIPFIVRIFCSPKTRDLGDIQAKAKTNYETLGELSKHEKCIIATFGIMLIMWILAETIHIPVLVTTLLGLCVFYSLGIVNIKDILSNHGTFNAVITLSIIISYVNCLTAFGAIDWFNKVVTDMIGGFPPLMSFLILSIIYFFAHYFFTGEGSRIIALYSSFLSIGMSLGIDKMSVSMTLAVFSSMSSILTHYSGPVAILIFSTGYVSPKKWLANGTTLALVIMCIWFSYLLVMNGQLM